MDNKVYECPVCGRKFMAWELIPCEIIGLLTAGMCPKCHAELVKTDNGEYTEAED